MWNAMSGWLSRFRSPQTTKEQLEQIESDIQSIEDYKWSKLRQQKNLMALIFYGLGLLYTIVAILFYFYFLPLSNDLYDKCIYSLPLIVLPVIAYLLHRAMQGYFRWVIESNEDRLTELRKEKRRILDKVMDTETYKVAKELLEKYDPSSLKTDKPDVSPRRTISTPDAQSLRFRGSPPQVNTPAARHFMNASNPNLNSSFAGPVHPTQSRPIQNQQQIQYSTNMQRMMATPAQPPRLVRPLLSQERSVVEKMVDFVVGDGPNNRYALICCFCHSHNGMALKDEFEYLSFKCCYCNTYNPARKLRPSAPRIAPVQPVIGELDSDTLKLEDTDKDDVTDGQNMEEKVEESSDKVEESISEEGKRTENNSDPISEDIDSKDITEREEL